MKPMDAIGQGEAADSEEPRSGLSLAAGGGRPPDWRIGGMPRAAAGGLCERRAEGSVALLGDGANGDPGARRRPSGRIALFPCTACMPTGRLHLPPRSLRLSEYERKDSRDEDSHGPDLPRQAR